MSRRLSAIALCAMTLGAGTAVAAERTLVLEIVINGRATGRVGAFVERDGVLYAKPSDLAEIGFLIPPGIPGQSDLIALSSLPELRARVDEARQTLLIEAGDAVLKPTRLGADTEADLPAPVRTGFGAVLNYDTSATFAGGRTSAAAVTDLSAFTPYGVFESTGFVNLTPATGQKSYVRLDTVFTGTQFSKLRRWRLGDVVTGTLPWSRAVRLGGIQIASDFGLRPDLITFPLPMINASAAVPSTVNVVVNGIQQLSAPVQAGPFAYRTLPVVTGQGQIAVTVSDLLGRQTVITLPFYSSAALLKPGLGSYSLEFGSVRQDYGQNDDRYSGWAANASGRYGLTDWLTLEGHGEATAGLGVAGGGVTLLVGTLGIINVAVAGSVAHSRGGMIAAGFERTTQGISIGVNGTLSTAGYRDIAARYGSSGTRSALNANLGYQLGRFGSIGVAYSGRVSWPQSPIDGLDASIVTSAATITDPPIRLLTGSYTAPIAGSAAFYATGFKDLRAGGTFGFGIGFSLSLGRGTTASGETSWDRGNSTWSASMVRSAQRQDDFGYRAQISQGATSRQSLEGEYLSRWGRVSGGADLTAGQFSGRVGARGALAVAGGDVFASDEIHDSFAIVSTGALADVPVLYENRVMGKTNAHGRLLIPSLLSYRDNKLAIDPTKLPPDFDVGETSIRVRPSDRSGVMVDFRIRPIAAALLTLHDRAGAPLPLGSIIRIAGAPDQPVGHDGEAYLTGLHASNIGAVTRPDGSTCHVTFDYAPVKGDIPLLGPLPCE